MGVVLVFLQELVPFLVDWLQPACLLVVKWLQMPPLEQCRLVLTLIYNLRVVQLPPIMQC